MENYSYALKAIKAELKDWEVKYCMPFFNIRLPLLTANWSVEGTAEVPMEVSLLNLKDEGRQLPYAFLLINGKLLAWHKLPETPLSITPAGINGRPLSELEFAPPGAAVAECARREMAHLLTQEYRRSGRRPR